MRALQESPWIMRRTTAIFLILIILLFAFFGWKALGWIALGIAGLAFVAVVSVMVGLWLVRRRMKRALRDLRAVFAQHESKHGPRPQQDVRREAIDVEPESVRRD
jgi:uncharacterized membrane protein YfcA